MEGVYDWIVWRNYPNLIDRIVFVIVTRHGTAWSQDFELYKLCRFVQTLKVTVLRGIWLLTSRLVRLGRIVFTLQERGALTASFPLQSFELWWCIIQMKARHFGLLIDIHSSWQSETMLGLFCFKKLPALADSVSVDLKTFDSEPSLLFSMSNDKPYPAVLVCNPVAPLLVDKSVSILWLSFTKRILKSSSWVCSLWQKTVLRLYDQLHQ